MTPNAANGRPVNSLELLAGRQCRTVPDVLAHVREQAALLVFRVNEGREWAGAEFADKTDEVCRAMLAKLGANLSGLGRADLAAKITTATRKAA